MILEKIDFKEVVIPDIFSRESLLLGTHDWKHAKAIRLSSVQVSGATEVELSYAELTLKYSYKKSL